MIRPEPFTFGIALTPRANARNWALIEALLDLTLASIRAQTDPNFRVVIACHDRPHLTFDDPRFEFVEVAWPVQEPGPHNDDSGRKKHALGDLVLERGGGLLMILDADDWVDVRLVAAARATIGVDQIGGLIEAGVVTDFQTLRAAPLPHPQVSELAFHRFCGSSGVVRLRPEASDPLRRNPFNVLCSHHHWVEVAAEHGAELARLPVSGSYVINTTENHSEVHGPYAEWRRTFTARVNRAGKDVDGALAARFGLDLARLRAASERFFAGGTHPTAPSAAPTAQSQEVRPAPSLGRTMAV
jgi:hypothetical protein